MMYVFVIDQFVMDYFVCSVTFLERDIFNTWTCFGCQGRHHLAVFDGGKSCVSDNSAMEAACNLPEMSTPAMHVSSGMHVFLQTAQVVVSRPGMGSAHSLKVRAIFDTEAQRSYVSQGVVDLLKLETIKTETLRIATFGNQDQQLQAVNLIELALTKPETGFEMTLNAFSVPRICSDSQGQDLHWVKETYPRLRDIDFTDTCFNGGPMQIDLLIGSDYIWNFFDGKTIRGEKSGQGGPVAVSTKAGWVLSGPIENLPQERLSSIQFSSTHVLRIDSR